MNITIKLQVNANNANLTQFPYLYKTLNAKVAILKFNLINKFKVYNLFCVQKIIKISIIKVSCICSLLILLIYLADLKLRTSQQTSKIKINHH
jgi:hypothetical protein